MSTSDRLQEHHNSLCQSGQMHAALVEQFLMVDDALGVRPVSAALRSAKINSTFLDNVLTCSCGPDTHETRRAPQGVESFCYALMHFSTAIS